jgi:hypothetical protein
LEHFKRAVDVDHVKGAEEDHAVGLELLGVAYLGKVSQRQVKEAEDSQPANNAKERQTLKQSIVTVFEAVEPPRDVC